MQDPSVPAAQDRPLPAVQRAYFYVVLLVAIHMIVLGVANVLRVGAEIALNAPSGGFTGLPFVFAEFNRPRELYREQASLATALLLVAVPAWYLHYRAADAAARRSAIERASALRSAYVQIVIFVTALLVFGYGQRVLRLVLVAAAVAPGSTQFGLEPDWIARAAGAFAMVVAAAGALVFHVRIASADRASVALSARAAGLGHLARYALAVIGLGFFTFSFASLLMTLWRELVFPYPQIEPFYPPGVPRSPPPGLDESVRFDLASSLPAIVSGIALWAVAWLRAERAVRAGRSAPTTRRIAVYLVIALSALIVLFGLTSSIALVLAPALGDRTDRVSLGRELGNFLPFAVVFAGVWWYHRRVVEGDAARETEAGRAAEVRRAYYYLIAAIGIAMAAIGTAGAIGAVGSGWLGLMNHDARETATWIALVLVGGPAWAFHWRASDRRLDDDERRSLQRRVYLYLAILGGLAAVLVFGSALLFNLLKGLLAFHFDTVLWHDLWHFSVDTTVGAVALAWHFRLARADRAALAAAGLEETYHVTLLVKAADRATAQARVAAAVEGQPDITLRG